MKLHVLAALVIAFSPLDDETAKPTTTDDDAPRFHCEWCRDTAGSGDQYLGGVENGIVWYGVWEDAVAEVQRTNRPLILHFAAPRCQAVPGVW